MNKQDFPLLNRKLNGKSLTYLNSAATTQKPKVVIDSAKEFYEKYNANLHRGSDYLSNETEKIYDSSRRKVANFLNSGVDEIVFTKSCTEAINLVVRGFNFSKNDKILVAISNHHSNFVPWKMLERRGLKIEFINVDKNGSLLLDENKIKGARLLAITHLSNVLGNVLDVRKICSIAHKHNCLVLVDCAQSAGKIKIDVKDLDCDFLAFSGHKMFSLNGVGVLYGKKKLLENVQPLIYGGDMIKDVSLKGVSFAEVPRRFEGGTADVASVYSLSKAIDYIDKLGVEKINKHIQDLTGYCLNKFGEIKNLEVYGANQDSVISFNLKEIHGHDVAEYLASKGISVRSGHMCCQPLISHLGLNSVVRVSFHIYNDKKDIDILVKELKNCQGFFKI